MTVDNDPTEGMSEAQLAEYYDTHRDLADFEGGEEVAVTRKPERTGRCITLSIRLSDSEMRMLEEAAKRAGMKVTAFVRQAALVAADDSGTVLNRDQLLRAIRSLERDLDAVRRVAAA
ncbi:DUF1778 domain-containing protein [Thermobifida alba]|jgi:uncharacterized protein (DUF1778 family)|uniref:DUF1778 domain-containing protein n=1 Tax=Thermobifida alba TaxID=53522 RepID=A0ABY4L2C4_THEAE|nr:DUF1778 domain-containing protein [Thermobifida alba]UPT21814.1 DUF1778 domain-containing protein [Thermobifida alba]HLU95763.1 DUF1778 domain-containing protein [Thermobifida alba]